MQRMVANKDNGHNLESLLQIAIKKGMAPLENEKIKLISALNIYYSDSGSRYYTEKRTPEEIFFEFDPCTIGDHVRIIEKINQETEKYAKSLPRNKSKGIAQKKRI